MDVVRLITKLPNIRGGGQVELLFTTRVDFAAAAIGILRACYLAAFATFGYRYIVQPSLDRVRAAIANNDRSVIPVITLDSGAIGDRFVVPGTEVASLGWAGDPAATTVHSKLTIRGGTARVAVLVRVCVSTYPTRWPTALAAMCHQRLCFRPAPRTPPKIKKCLPAAEQAPNGHDQPR